MKNYCDYHEEKHQELWPGEMLCESCFTEATLGCKICHQVKTLNEDHTCINCEEASKDVYQGYDEDDRANDYEIERWVA